MTRKERAALVLKRVAEGPSLHIPNLTQEQCEALTQGYRRWANSWIVPVLKDLIPELKAKRTAPVVLPTLTVTTVTRSCTVYAARFSDDTLYSVTTYPDSELIFVESVVTRRRVAKNTRIFRFIVQALEARKNETA